MQVTAWNAGYRPYIMIITCGLQSYPCPLIITHYPLPIGYTDNYNLNGYGLGVDWGNDPGYGLDKAWVCPKAQTLPNGIVKGTQTKILDFSLNCVLMGASIQVILV
jgi:hypothetical protein